MPAQKKDPATRRRRNKASTSATLVQLPGRPTVPDLPDHPSGEGWHVQAQDWWKRVWSSPMSTEWDPDSDYPNVLLCALLVHDAWSADTATARTKAMTEFRLQRSALGLTPYDRRRLEWTIELADEATEKGNTRRARTAPAKKRAVAAVDPRARQASS